MHLISRLKMSTTAFINGVSGRLNLWSGMGSAGNVSSLQVQATLEKINFELAHRILQNATELAKQEELLDGLIRKQAVEIVDRAYSVRFEAPTLH